MSSVYSVVEADKRFSPLCIPARKTSSAGRHAWPSAQCPNHDGTIRWPSRSRRSAIPCAGRRRSAGIARERTFVVLSYVDRFESLELTFELEVLNCRMLNNYKHTGSKDDASAHCNRIGEFISSEWILRRRVALASHWQRVATKWRAVAPVPLQNPMVRTLFKIQIKKEI